MTSPILDPNTVETDALRQRLSKQLNDLGPGAFEDLYGSLQDLVNSDEDAAQVFMGFARAMIRSFLTDQVKLINITAHEMRRRILICVELFKIYRGDLYWSITRTLDHLPTALRNRLDGVEIDVSKERETWLARDETISDI